jgi:hypothetical protein
MVQIAEAFLGSNGSAAEGIPPSRSSTLADVQATLAAGIEFIGSPTDRPGIRFAAPVPTAAKPK